MVMLGAVEIFEGHCEEYSGEDRRCVFAYDTTTKTWTVAYENWSSDSCNDGYSFQEVINAVQYPMRYKVCTALWPEGLYTHVFDIVMNIAKRNGVTLIRKNCKSKFEFYS